MSLSGMIGMKAAILASFVIVLFLCRVLYDLFLHPVAKYPGPWYCRISRLPYHYYQVRGLLPQFIKDIHEKYGPIVRIAPNDLSFTESQAWYDIHRHRATQGMKNFPRDPSVYPEIPGRAPSIFLSNESDHARFRRLLSHAFSAQALREQEPILRSHVDLLNRRLDEEIDGPKHGKVDLTMWLNYTAFDIVGDLSFGESFGCLQNKQSHPWVDTMCSSISGMTYMAAMSHLPRPIFLSIVWFMENYTLKNFKEAQDYSIEKVNKRIALGTGRNDFMSPILRANDEKGMTVDEIESSFNIIISAGSETTASAISTVLYYLTFYPDVTKKVIEELTSAFETPGQISIQAVESLPYLNAIIQEAMRICPPASFSQSRLVPSGGATVCGEFLPEGVAVGAGMYAGSLSPDNWTDPEEFKPERWIGEGFQGDDRKSSQPFSMGPRMCIGKNLAYAEMRLVLASLLLNFEWKLCDESRNWIHGQLHWLSWDRPPLYFNITRRTIGEEL